MSLEHGCTNLCENCGKAVENDSRPNSFQIMDINDLGFDEILFVDAISYVYGISWDEFQASEHFKYSYSEGQCPKETSIKLCDTCVLLFSDIYKAHRRFEELSQGSSFVHQINKFRRREWELVSQFQVKREIADCAEFSDNHCDDDIDFYSAPNSEELDNVQGLPFENKYETKSGESLKSDLDPTTNQDTCNAKPKSFSSILSSLKTRQVFVKLDKLSSDDLKFYNVIPKKLSEGKKSTTIKATGSDDLNLPKPKVKKKKFYTCKLCGKTFSDHRNFSGHKAKHLGIKFNCDLCGKSLASKKVLGSHLQNVHGHGLGNRNKNKSSVKLPCELCGKLLSGLHSLNQHIKFMHGQVEEFKCETCGRTFNRKKNYNDHVLIHSETFTPYVCKHCGKTFMSKNVHLTHEKLHSGKEFPCDICSKVFRTKEYLVLHASSAHAVDRKYVCDECGKAYKFKSNFLSHLRDHREMAEKGRIECDVCGKAFGSRRNMRAHKLRKHRKNLKNNLVVVPV